MKIISKYKDYYDYISHQYGIDEKVVYNRSYQEESIIIENVNLDSFIFLKNKNSLNEKTYYVKCLIICGKQFLILSDYKNNKVLTNEDLKIYPQISNKLGIYNWNVFRKECNIDKMQNVFNEKLLDINIKYKQPVLMLCSYDIRFNEYYSTLPILKNINGLAGLYSPESIYQDISYFFLNQINGSPDIDIPVKIEDKYLIEQKGFDLKKSFRHRK